MNDHVVLVEWVFHGIRFQAWDTQGRLWIVSRKIAAEDFQNEWQVVAFL